MYFISTYFFFFLRFGNVAFVDVVVAVVVVVVVSVDFFFFVDVPFVDVDFVLPFSVFFPFPVFIPFPDFSLDFGLNKFGLSSIF